ncbi:unnamed protein product [Tilletia laevis]|uniref:Ndc10 domain-containing protein n=2 Tax=Tilletia TaxID=13289 RepID=A0A9N8LGW3_9BASI|nr:unnamed protein product [Tilletia laevis]CAD6898015.1 unnamed protein product [Tilletia caries]CAD6899255.1 unnamed protein product [Tilletia laevis]CAD6927963.1 unnamed protein product [Tilletia caries]
MAQRKRAAKSVASTVVATSSAAAASGAVAASTVTFPPSQLTVTEEDEQAEAATRQRGRDNRAESTKQTWGSKKREFVEFCKERYPTERVPETVTGTKLHAYLQLRHVGRISKRPRKTGVPADQQVVGFSLVDSHASAVIDLWQEQHDEKVNAHPHPRTLAVKSLLNNFRLETAARNAANFKDKRGTADDGYNHEFYLKMARHFLMDGSLVSTRSLVAQLLGHQTLMRGINLRKLALSDLELGRLQEGLSPAVFLVVKVDESKTNRTGRVEYSGALRHKDPVVDPLFALALYLFQRWEIIGEPFPDLTNNKSWYKTRLLRGQDDATTVLSYDAHRNPILKSFHDLGLRGCKKVTHAARGSGAREAELAGVASSDIERLGGWKQSKGAMEQSYLTHLPVRALRALAGFSPDGGTYFLRRDGPDPSEDLLKMIFPQVEVWQASLDEDTISATGGADKFLELVRFLRRVLLQDIFILQDIQPAHPVLRHVIFKSEQFSAWTVLQRSHLEQVDHPMELALKQVMPQIHEQLVALGEQQKSTLQYVQDMQRASAVSTELQRRRDEVLMHELQRHTAAVMRIKFADLSSLPSSAAADNAGASSATTEGGTSGTSALFLTPATALNSPAEARSIPHTTSSSPPLALEAAPSLSYGLSPSVRTVAQVWEEWKVGFNGGPSLEGLEKEHGTKWCGGPASAARRAFLRRMVIVKAIQDTQGQSVEMRIAALQRKMGAHSLDWFRKQLSS